MAKAWCQSAWADYSGVSRTLTTLFQEEAEQVTDILHKITQLTLDGEVMTALQLSGRLTYDGDLTGRPVSNSSSTYPNAGYGHMDNAIRLSDRDGQSAQPDFDLTYLFVSHDLSVIRHICDRGVVMYVGKVVEVASGLDPYLNPKHPYTEALMSAVPVSNPRARDKGVRIHLEGQVADPANPPSGCYFHPRCNYAQDICATDEPQLRDLGEEHFAACHFATELELAGVRMV